VRERMTGACAFFTGAACACGVAFEYACMLMWRGEISFAYTICGECAEMQRYALV